MLASLLPDVSPFATLQTTLAGLKPSQVLAPAVEALKPLTDLIASLDPTALFEPLLAAIERIRDEIPDLIARIEAAFDEVLAAFPEGGTDSASVSVSAG